MSRITARLEEWRAAERRRDALPPGSPEWHAADDGVQSARAAYRGETSQATAYYAELDYADGDRQLRGWSTRPDRRTVLG